LIKVPFFRTSSVHAHLSSKSIRLSVRC